MIIQMLLRPPKKLHHIPCFKKLVYFIARRVVNSERKVKLFSCNKIQHGIELIINVYLVEQLKNLGVSWTDTNLKPCLGIAVFIKFRVL